MSARRIPQFNSSDDEAEFWATTRLEDLAAGEVEEIRVERAPRPLSTTFAVRLDDTTVATIRRIASTQGVGPTQLVRSWILRQLDREQRLDASETTEMADVLETLARRLRRGMQSRMA